MNKDADMSFWNHLDEFRNRLIVVVVSIFLGALIGYFYSENIIQILVFPGKQQNISFQVITVTSMFMIKLGVSFFAGAD